MRKTLRMKRGCQQLSQTVMRKQQQRRLAAVTTGAWALGMGPAAVAVKARVKKGKMSLRSWMKQGTGA
jgi:hypothetical protein